GVPLFAGHLGHLGHLTAPGTTWHNGTQQPAWWPTWPIGHLPLFGCRVLPLHSSPPRDQCFSCRAFPAEGFAGGTAGSASTRRAWRTSRPSTVSTTRYVPGGTGTPSPSAGAVPPWSRPASALPDLRGGRVRSHTAWCSPGRVLARRSRTALPSASVTRRRTS